MFKQFIYRSGAVLGLGLWGCISMQSAFATNPDAEQAMNMKLVGYSDLQARTAYQPTIQKQGNRWIAYMTCPLPAVPE
jgi:hypothetical protein